MWMTLLHQVSVICTSNEQYRIDWRHGWKDLVRGVRRCLMTSKVNRVPAHVQCHTLRSTLPLLVLLWTEPASKNTMCRVTCWLKIIVVAYACYCVYLWGGLLLCKYSSSADRYSLASNVGYGLSKVPAYFIVSTIARKKRQALHIPCAQ